MSDSAHGSPVAAPSALCSSSTVSNSTDNTASSTTPQSSSIQSTLTHAGVVVSKRWYSGCFHEYMGTGCKDKETCPFLHDLTAFEQTQFIEWKGHMQKHTVYESREGCDTAIGGDTVYEGVPKVVADPVSLDDLACLPSVGSRHHAVGACVPCRRAETPDGCPDGQQCLLCHEDHDANATPTKPRKGKQRPCKEKRDRYRKLVSRITSRIEHDPEAFDLNSIDLPPSVASNQVLKSKLTRRMTKKAEEVLSGRIVTSQSEEDLPSSSAEKSTSVKPRGGQAASSSSGLRPGLIAL